MLPDAMWQYAKSSHFVPLSDVRIGQSCIFLSEPQSDGFPIYCRSVITKFDEQLCDLFLVDYAESKVSQPISKLFEIPSEFVVMDRQAIKCMIAQLDELRAQFDIAERKKAFVDGVNGVEVKATIRALQADGTAIVDVLFGTSNRDLREICEKISDDGVNAFGN